uniref:protein-tyrosine-phosphatase n=1 Tax=Parastrongyloides trichosuri TaxID=131310 RepID=A0A0N4ZBH1_PARTI
MIGYTYKLLFLFLLILLKRVYTGRNDVYKVPPGPEDIKVEAINATTVQVSWKAPSSYSGVILGYNVYKEKLFNGEPVDNKLHKAISIYPKEQLSAIITDLEPNTEYSFRVNAENKFGDGEHSDPVKIMMDGLPPSAPIIQSLSLIKEEPPLTAKIEWLPPKESYGKSITKYHLWYRPDIHTEFSRIDVPGDERSIEIKDLIMFREYTFVLAAATVDGVGANTTESLSTPAGIPSSPPLNVRYDIVRGKIIFAWDPPPLDQQNGNISYYKAILTSDSRRPLVKNVTEGTSIALAMPVKSTSTFKVAAATMSGLGPESPGLIVYPDASASVSAPTNVKVQATSNSSVVVLWEYDDKNFDSSADGFVIKYIHEPSSRGPHHDIERWRSLTIMDSKARSFEVGQLTAHKPYAFCVLTVKQSRQGPCSDPPVTIDQLKPIYVATNLRVEYKTSTSVSLRWDYHGPNDVEIYINQTSRKSYLDQNLEKRDMVSPGFRKILKSNERSVLWDNLRPHMEHTFKVGIKHKDTYYWPKEIIVQTDNTGPPFVDKPEFIESKSPTTVNVRLKCASEEYGPISHYWIIVVPSNYTQDNVNNLDSQALKYHSEMLKAQLHRDGYNSQVTGNVIKKVRRQSQSKDGIILITDNEEFVKRVARYSGGALPTVPYVTAGISAQRMQIMQKEKELFTIGDGKIYDGFENFPLHPASKYKLMMRSFAKELEGKKSFTQRAPMNQPRAKKYADSMLTAEFSTSSSMLDRSSRPSNLWLVGPLIAVLIITIILGMLVIWWWKCNKKNVSHCTNRHGSITKVALTDSGKGVLPNETSKLLLGTDSYGRPVINAYDMPPGHNSQCNMGVMESSLIDMNAPSQVCDSINTAYKMTNGHVPQMYGSHDNYQDLPMPMPILSDSATVIGRHNITRPPIPISDLASHIDHLRMNGNQLFTQEYESIETSNNFTWENSNIVYNKSKNRYANVVAYDHSRVILSTINGIPGSDYINANYIDGYDKPKAYIATQGPLPETFNDFWRMVWEEKSMTIVMLTKLEEMNRIKCDQYWPSRGSQVYGNIHVTILDTLELAHYIIRTFRIEHLLENEIRDIRQMQYTSWPDHGVPDHTTPFLMFLKRVKTLNHSDAGPIISHCSAGIGRTGAFIVIDCMLERLRYENTVDIYECVCNLRSQRCYMVQTDDQYIFIHDAVLDAVQSGSTEVPASKLFPHIQVLMQLHPLDQVSGMELEFRTLSSLRITTSRFEIASHPVNRSKNRNSVILPYDSTRVILKMISGIEGSDYINANWIDGYRQRKAYITTQSPLPHTANDFWRMIWETESSVVVMLTKLKEMRTERSYEYWPSENSAQYGFLIVEPIAEYNMPQYILREFRMNDTQTGISKTIRHFQYMDWPEHGVPQSADMFLEFVQQIHQTCSQFGLDGPITVHDHLGTGRAGVFIAVSIIIDRMKLEHVVDVFTTVKLLRIDRPMMVQEKEEYNFCYQAALEFLASYENPYLMQ